MDKLLKNDFYEYVNAEWLKTAKIPEDRASIGSFVELDINLEKLLKSLIKKWVDKEKEQPKDYPMVLELIKFYQLVINEKQRAMLEWQPVKEFLSKLNQINSFDDLFKQDRDFWLEYTALPIQIQLWEDFVDNEKRIVWLDSLPTILPAKETYNQADKNKLLNVWRNMVLDLLVSFGIQADMANKMIQNAIDFDNYFKDHILSAVEQADYVSLYKLKQRDELKTYSKQVNLANLLDLIVGQKVTEASIPNLKLFEEFDEIFCTENFNKYKDFLFIKNLLATTGYLSEEIRIKATEFKNALNAVEKVRNLEDYAYDLTTKFFGMPLGMYYADKYFGSKAKKDVENMIASMIQIYKESLLANTWLSKETIKKAIIKLEAFEPMVGYPEEIRPYYAKFKVKSYQDGSNIFANVKKFVKLITEYNFSLYHKAESRKMWSMTPVTINAYYTPIHNQIVFPAAILAAPFYDINQSKSANYGGIGAVIAHEISHGFDNNGSQFDEKGRLNNWWTEHDLHEFKKRTQAAIALYDQTPTPFGKVNGKLTVSENIADLGGFACALEAAKREADFNAKEFFISWARIWRSIYKDGLAKRLLESDVHSPTKVRANKVLSNCDLFIETFNIKKGDQMFIDKSKRVKIW
ncbi:putative endopeptidase [Mycoplasmopsis mustelae]|uniref:Putative endopeptidase n=1 Tax=Mycoplasmopsis mustelae TaxID=171289 RepID=A0A4R7UD76_9BACT|nr:M13 family metallopeptidase [Mycoplasmopsis mustelae]TDV24432.1 putative endopeptidase [Mycoplasmopsis mustelae]